MKNIIHVYIMIASVIFSLIVFVIILFPEKKVLTCIKENGDWYTAYEKYVFTGYRNTIKLEERYCKMIDDKNHGIINKYYEILKDDETVQDIKIVNDTIEWYQKRSMVNYENLNNCKDEKGNILFSKVKKYFESIDYICNY
ncbi:MAG: hypothetical protein J6C28_06145 [Bacilli bacterium]|nr:hypothetical protein [Bacilli bacterium]